ncbi:MAG: CHAT domain-containing protein [Myxococcales bacterium]|nr:CHAT domain-containing protein [Myxococcales bacterium]
MAVLIHAIKHKRPVLQVAKEGKMPAADGRALMLWADVAGFRSVAWVKPPPLDKTGKKDVQRALSLRKDAVVAHRKHDATTTLRLLRQAHALFMRRLGPNHPRTFETAGQVAYTLIRLRNFDAADKVLKQLLIRQKVAYGPGHPNTADARQLLGQIAFERQQYDKARTHYLAAMKVAVSVWGTSHPKVRVLWNNLAGTLNELGDDAGYERAYRRSLAIAQTIFGPDHNYVATDLTNLGVLLMERAKHQEAERRLLGGIRIRQKNDAPAADIAGSYHNLGALKQFGGDFAQAKRYLSKALEFWGRGHDPKRLKRASTLLILGQVLQAMGDFQGAMVGFRQCLDIRQAGLPRGHPDTARVLMQMGQLMDYIAAKTPAGQERTDALDKARQLLSSAHVQTRKALGEGHPDTMRRLAALANHFVSRGEPKKAAPLLARVVKQLTAKLGPAHPQVGAVWNNLGVAQADAGQLSQALKSYQKAENVLTRAQGAWHPDVQAVRLNRARMLLALGRVRAATKVASTASDQLLDHIAASASSASSDMALLQQVSRVSGLFNVATSAYALARNPRGGFAHALRWQGAGTRFEQLWRQLKRAEATASPQGRRTLQAYQQAKRTLLRLRGAGPAGSAKDTISRDAAARRRSLAAVRKRLAGLQRDIARHVPVLSRHSQALRPTVKGVCAALRRDRSSLVDFVQYVRLPTGEARYGAYVVDGKRCKVRWIELGAASNVEAAVGAWRSGIDAATRCFGRRKVRFCKRPFRALDQAGKRLRKLIWDPLGGALGAGSRTWIVPSAALASVAFDALPSREGRYLIEDRVLGYLPHPAAAVAVRARHPRSGQSALVVGDLDYNAADSPNRATRAWQTCTAAGCSVAKSPKSRPIIEFSATVRGAPVCGRLASWRPLPQTEASTVARALAGRLGGRVWLAPGRSAPEAVVRAALPGRRYIHLATHGFFSDRKTCSKPVSQQRINRLLASDATAAGATPLIDPMAMSAVVLSGANGFGRARHPRSDGVLSAREVARLDLNGTALAVLSACETGLGVQTSAEGSLGLSRAFLVAGAAHTIVSLWQVPSRETTVLFERFYKELAAQKSHDDPVTALRRARLALLADLRARNLAASTFLWAAFVPLSSGL